KHASGTGTLLEPGPAPGLHSAVELQPGISVCAHLLPDCGLRGREGNASGESARVQPAASGNGAAIGVGSGGATATRVQSATSGDQHQRHGCELRYELQFAAGERQETP